MEHRSAAARSRPAPAGQYRRQQRWTYIHGLSRQRLPGLLSELGQIDLFVHDSLHSERNVRVPVPEATRAMMRTAVLSSSS
jgi:hypothetical protein